jgi:DNA polymerase-3 subunit alpha
MNVVKEFFRFDTHAHSEYSNLRLLDSINKIPDMIKTANSLGLMGITLTDHECLSGHVELLEEEKRLKKEKVIPEKFKCALGNEIYLVKDRKNIEKYFHYILIAKNNQGHRALRELSSIAWYNGFSSRGMYRVPTEMSDLERIVRKYPNSLIASNGCIGGYIGNRVLSLIKAEGRGLLEETNKIKKDIDDFLKWNIELFGEDFYFEIAAGNSDEQRAFNKRVKDIVKEYNLKIIIGSDAHYLTAKERPLHKAYLNSKEGEREVDQFYWDAHFMDNKEVYNNISDFYSLEEFEQICKNSMEIYKKIEGYNFFKKPIIPEVVVKNYSKKEGLEKYPTLSYLLKSDEIQERYWINECLFSLKRIGKWNEEYLARLEIEADVIRVIGEKLNNVLFKYFNTFKHYIDLFWDCGSVLLSGRGSSVCFLSNYLMGITQLDPIKWNLKYWRFLNKERIELPDIDIDLSPSKRKMIFEKIREERGELNLIQVCTFGTETLKSAINSGCRGYRSKEYPDGLPIETAQYLSSLIPKERGFLPPLKDVLYGNEEKGTKPIKSFINEIEKYPGLLEILEAIEGLKNKRGQHASGVVLYNKTPFETNALMRSPNGDLTTQYDLHTSEKLGK